MNDRGLISIYMLSAIIVLLLKIVWEVMSINDNTKKTFSSPELSIRVKGYIQEAAPEVAKENDIWLQPETREFYILKNGEWKKAGDTDIPPYFKTAMMSWAGLDNFGFEKEK